MGRGDLHGGFLGFWRKKKEVLGGERAGCLWQFVCFVTVCDAKGALNLINDGAWMGIPLWCLRQGDFRQPCSKPCRGGQQRELSTPHCKKGSGAYHRAQSPFSGPLFGTQPLFSQPKVQEVKSASKGSS